jgi:hypothetical protein
MNQQLMSVRQWILKRKVGDKVKAVVNPNGKRNIGIREGHKNSLFEIEVDQPGFLRICTIHNRCGEPYCMGCYKNGWHDSHALYIKDGHDVFLVVVPLCMSEPQVPPELTLL